MSNTTNVPGINWLPTGPVAPQESAVLSGTQQDINAAFGGNLNMTQLTTPQNQIASSNAAIIQDKNADMVYLANQMDPNNASGKFQDAIGRIYFMERIAGTPTTVQLLCVGEFTTPIPVGAKVQDTSGNFYVCQQAGTIPISGQITLPFACVNIGPTACPANTVIYIVSGIAGWDTVDNPLAGAVGSNVESRAAFEYRRQQQVAIGAWGSITSVAAAVFDVDNVIDVFAYENITNATVNYGTTNYPVVAHSIYIAAVGGAPTDIANAMFQKKSPGCNMNGNTTVTITDASFLPPQPSYTYTYNIPTNTAFAFAVQIQNNSNLPANIVTLVQNAIVASFTGADGSQRARTGSTVLAGKYYAAATAVAPSVVNVESILINIKPGSPTLTNVTLGIDQFPTLQASDVSVSLV